MVNGHDSASKALLRPFSTIRETPHNTPTSTLMVQVFESSLFDKRSSTGLKLKWNCFKALESLHNGSSGGSKSIAWSDVNVTLFSRNLDWTYTARRSATVCDCSSRPVCSNSTLPLASKIKGKPVRLGLKQRMGIGILCSCASVITLAVVEYTRRNIAVQGLSDEPHALVHTSALQLLPYYVLGGLAGAFNGIGQVEFCYPK
ncbi:hypothetical protein V6N13_106456 [Hibiscus sabdariffa]|uniref:Uncharacterized protein n=1 Tax=Hibiscus sabdariffa TaxID=183260 RepID=A0ABR2F0R0_9ROSI